MLKNIDYQEIICYQESESMKEAKQTTIEPEHKSVQWSLTAGIAFLIRSLSDCYLVFSTECPLIHN